MWEVLVAVVALLGGAVFGSIATIVLEEVSTVPETIRAALRAPGTPSLSTRVAMLESRLGVIERKVPRSAA